MSRSAQGAVDAVVATFFSAFDNREGRVPNWAELVALFVPGASITKIDGLEFERMSVAEFVEPRQEMLANGSLVEFSEWETGHQTIVGVGIATRICNYSKKGLQSGQPYRGEGQKHIQLILTSQGWKISSVIWEDE